MVPISPESEPVTVAADGARIEEDALEAQARVLARELRLQGLSMRGVAAELERRGVRSRSGRGFAPVQVKRMVGWRMTEILLESLGGSRVSKRWTP
jgi:hypothetical protein